MYSTYYEKYKPFCSFSEKWLPSSEVIIEGISGILKTFEDVVEAGIIKARWEEIKKLQSSNYAMAT